MQTSSHRASPDPVAQMPSGGRLLRCLIWLIGIWALGFLATAPLEAMETDQFLAWRTSLDDVAEPLNQFLNDRVEAVVEHRNEKFKGEDSCPQLVVAILRDLHLNPFAAPVRSFLENDEAIDRSPRDMGNFGYFKASIFRRPAWPFYLPLASTVNVGGVLVGLDKFGHVFGSGRRYYEQYREALESGESEQEAMRRAILFGVTTENGLLGRMADGIFSYADLEANFQGLLMAIDLCAEDSPNLARNESGWQLVRPVDMRDYINPDFDESYNNNLYSPYRWRNVRGILERDYCPIYVSASVQALHASYRQRMERPSFSAEVIREYMGDRGKPAQEEQSMRKLCRSYLPSMHMSPLEGGGR